MFNKAIRKLFYCYIFLSSFSLLAVNIAMLDITPVDGKFKSIKPFLQTKELENDIVICKDEKSTIALLNYEEYSRNKKSKIPACPYLSHATQVASILIAPNDYPQKTQNINEFNPKHFKLFNFPLEQREFIILRKAKKISDDVAFYQFVEGEFEKNLSSSIKEATTWFDKHRISLVNLSIEYGIPVDDNKSELFSSLQRDLYALTNGDGVKVERLLQIICRFHKNFIQELSRKNPHILFIKAAGNQGMKIEGDIEDNTLYVGGIDVSVGSAGKSVIQLGSVIGYNSISNYSSEIVEVAANMKPYIYRDHKKKKNNFLYGDMVFGTSFATPIITRFIAQIMLENPQLKPREVKTIFLENYTKKDSQLNHKVKDGRYLL